MMTDVNRDIIATGMGRLGHGTTGEWDNINKA